MSGRDSARRTGWRRSRKRAATGSRSTGLPPRRPDPRLSVSSSSRPTRSTTSWDWIDWTPFFQTWELRGHYPAILDDPRQGAAARSLFADAKALLDRIVKERLLEARAVFGFLPAAADGDDIEVYVRRRPVDAEDSHSHACASR